MQQILSPYELLRQSKPKPAIVLVTPYDRYSAAMQQKSVSANNAAQESVCDTPFEEPQSTMPIIQQRMPRTHYIADIKRRHTAAEHRAHYSASNHFPV